MAKYVILLCGTCREMGPQNWPFRYFAVKLRHSSDMAKYSRIFISFPACSCLADMTLGVRWRSTRGPLARDTALTALAFGCYRCQDTALTVLTLGCYLRQYSAWR